MRHSIRTKLAAAVVGLIAAAIAVCIILNFFFLNSFYANNRKNELEKAYEVVMDVFDSTNSTKLTDENIQKLAITCDRYGISLIITDPSIDKIYVYGDSTDILTTRLKKTLINISEGYTEGTVIKSNNDYIMVKIHDKAMKLDYFELTAVMDSNMFILMRVAIENIHSYAVLANVFFAFTGVCVIILSMIVVSAIAYKINYRLLRLVNISKKMTNMDFDARYNEGASEDEIDILGNNINKMADELEKNISELKSANLELQKDIQKKNEIDEMRTQFLSSVSHELKTPLAIIQGYAEGLKESVNDDPESRDFYCDVIMDEASKMNTMVKKLLTLNQIESGGGSLELEHFDIVEVIKQRLNAIAILIEQKDAKVIFNSNEEMYVWADEFKIEEVITNYLSNALNHLDYEKVIKITIEKMKDDIVRITIFNSGNHIPDKDIDNIWDKFYKVDKARTREYGGSGIGLSIVKAIMNSHNRECGVMNVKGGVAFWFELDGQNIIDKK